MLAGARSHGTKAPLYLRAPCGPKLTTLIVKCSKFCTVPVDDSKVMRLFREHGGVLRTSEALALGVRSAVLYRLRDEGRLELLSRGVFRLAEGPDLAAPDLVAVAKRVRRGVVCLVSALHFHGMTLEVPHEVYVALPRGTKSPRIDAPPVRFFHFSGAAYSAGVRAHDLGGHTVRVYEPAKTVADCFKFRNRVGLDVALEALRAAYEQRLATPAEIAKYARINRVDRVMQPYLEALS